MRRKPHSLLAWEKRAIAIAYGAKEKLDAIAAEFNITTTMASRIGRKAGHPARRPKKFRTVLKTGSSVEPTGESISPSAGDAR